MIGILYGDIKILMIIKIENNEDIKLGLLSLLGTSINLQVADIKKN